MKAKDLGQSKNKDTVEQIKKSAIFATVNEVLIYDRDDFPNLWGERNHLVNLMGKWIFNN